MSKIKTLEFTISLFFRIFSSRDLLLRYYMCYYGIRPQSIQHTAYSYRALILSFISFFSIFLVCYSSIFFFPSYIHLKCFLLGFLMPDVCKKKTHAVGSSCIYKLHMQHRTVKAKRKEKERIVQILKRFIFNPFNFVCTKLLEWMTFCM